MIKNLVIVESPAKARTIERFLGSDYKVMSSYGHIRDLARDNMGIDVTHGFAPNYEISPEKQQTVRELRNAAKQAQTVWLASDEDREGEAIAWHLTEVLALDPKTTNRIVFHEITKPAIMHAVQNPRRLDMNLVDAQQARRILDRLVGFEVSPVLWKKVKPSLSAGRVQSVAVRLVVDREREIQHFHPEQYFKVQAILKQQAQFKAEVQSKLPTQQAARDYLQACQGATFTVASVEEKETRRAPAPPFTTSTLQQEASRKLSMNPKLTMSVAQRLYEQGFISYMRTDSVNLSEEAKNNLGAVIAQHWGEEYHQRRNFHTTSKGAQEAHEAIRPTHPEQLKTDLGSDEDRLYRLIWARALASQMRDAELLLTTVVIQPSTHKTPLVAKGEAIKFDGFLKVYLEGRDDDGSEEAAEGQLPRLREREQVTLISMSARERYSNHPPRYTEAMLVKELEKRGIGRPSTYATIISTIIKRGYVSSESREGKPRSVWCMQLDAEGLHEGQLSERVGQESRKLFPSDIGMLVNDYLVEHFPQLMDYNFTANVEEQFDRVASGQLQWAMLIHEFYGPFHQRVTQALERGARADSSRLLGNDPASGKPVYVRIGRYGPLAQIGESDDEQKPRYASLQQGQLIETITLEEALKLFQLPRTLGEYEGQEMVVGSGRFGPYVRHAGVFCSLGRDDDPYTITAERAIELIQRKRERTKEATLRTFPEDQELVVMKGRWGAYISYKKRRFRIPKDMDYAKASYQELLALTKSEATSGKTTTKAKTSATKRKSTSGTRGKNAKQRD